MTPTLVQAADAVTTTRRLALILAIIIAGVLPSAAQTTLGTPMGRRTSRTASPRAPAASPQLGGMRRDFHPQTFWELGVGFFGG
jgi:hypothetical protein